MRVKASSIFYALTLTVLIGFFLGGMVLFSGVNKHFNNQLDLQSRLMDNAYSGIEYGLANSQELSINDPVEIQLFDTPLDSVTIERRNWGAFEVINAKAHHGNNFYVKSTLAGQKSDQSLANLFLVDQGRPLSICGETRIEGKCEIPESGLKRAYIEGKNYTGKQMLYGSQLKSSRSLPPFNEELIQNVEKIKGQIIPWENKDSVVVSFQEEPVHFINDYITVLDGNYLSGQVFLEVKDSIYISADTHLQDVIIKSKIIHVEKGFKGCAQLLATERITLEEDVVMLYPSVLGIVEELKPTEHQSTITIGERSQVIGGTFAISKHPDFRKPVQINIEKEAELDGLLYCQGKTQLKGTVKGSLYTQKFYLETAASKYENHLLDAQILKDLPEEFVFVPIFKSTEPLTPISWLQ